MLMIRQMKHVQHSLLAKMSFTRLPAPFAHFPHIPHTHSSTHTHAHTLFLSLIHTLTLSLSSTHTHSHSHTHTVSFTHTLVLLFLPVFESAFKVLFKCIRDTVSPSISSLSFFSSPKRKKPISSLSRLESVPRRLANCLHGIHHLHNAVADLNERDKKKILSRVSSLSVRSRAGCPISHLQPSLSLSFLADCQQLSDCRSPEAPHENELVRLIGNKFLSL